MVENQNPKFIAKLSAIFIATSGLLFGISEGPRLYAKINDEKWREEARERHGDPNFRSIILDLTERAVDNKIDKILREP